MKNKRILLNFNNRICHHISHADFYTFVHFQTQKCAVNYQQKHKSKMEKRHLETVNSWQKNGDTFSFEIQSTKPSFFVSFKNICIFQFSFVQIGWFLIFSLKCNKNKRVDRLSGECNVILWLSICMYSSLKFFKSNLSYLF